MKLYFFWFSIRPINGILKKTGTINGSVRKTRVFADKQPEDTCSVATIDGVTNRISDQLQNPLQISSKIFQIYFKTLDYVLFSLCDCCLDSGT